MSFLYPLFLAGIAAIGIPIVLHMARRKTRRQVTFSSLMFVPAAAPRFKNRSRIENVLLLALRCAVFCLLAFAFSRPFFPKPAAEEGAKPARRIVVLIDTSASMRRTGLWAQALSETQSLLDGTDRADRVCVMSFDQTVRTVMGFEQWAALEPDRRAAVVAEQISKVSPGWALTNLGGGLVAAAEAIEDDEVSDAQLPVRIHQVVLISDLQQGSDLDTLSAYEWPKETELIVKSIQCAGTTNASLQLVTQRDEAAGADGAESPAIRITNSSDATAERFGLNWADEMPADESGQAAGVYVAPGHSVVVRAPRRADPAGARKLILTGDEHDFDNTLYVAPHLQQQVDILYIGGDDPNDPRDMLYYVQRAFGATGALKPRVISRRGNKVIAATEIEAAHLIIAADEISEENSVALRRYLESGRTLLLVMKSPDAAGAVGALAGIDNLQAQEANVDRYAMLDQIEFEHPLLVPFSEPRFGDFTQIHFWKHRRINIADCPGARLLASFDSGDPAWFELPVGKGALLVFTCGWHPSDSQLALSSKFVTLLYLILEYGGTLRGQQLQYFTGDAVPMPHWTMSERANVQIRKPDDSVISVDAEQRTFAQTDLPGIYTVESPTQKQLFAVNLPVEECRTAPMPIEDLEKSGVSLKPFAGVAVERIEQARHHRNLAEMEYEQKVWRWVLLAVLAVLLIEIWLAGLLTRPAVVS